MLADTAAVHHRPVRGAEVDELVAAVDRANLRVAPRRARIGHGDVGRGKPPDRDGVPLPKDALGELHGLEAAPERLREEALHDALEATFEVSEDGQGRSRFRAFPQVDDRTAGL